MITFHTVLNSCAPVYTVHWPVKQGHERSFLTGLQAPGDVDGCAVKALADLRKRRLLSFSERVGASEPTWAASARGRAVYESALPTRSGERLYEVKSL